MFNMFIYVNLFNNDRLTIEKTSFRFISCAKIFPRRHENMIY